MIACFEIVPKDIQNTHAPPPTPSMGSIHFFGKLSLSGPSRSIHPKAPTEQMGHRPESNLFVWINQPVFSDLESWSHLLGVVCVCEFCGQRPNIRAWTPSATFDSLWKHKILINFPLVGQFSSPAPFRGRQLAFLWPLSSGWEFWYL